MTAVAERVRKHRARQRANRMICSVEFSDAVILAGIVSGRLSENAAQRREQVARMAAEVLEDWADRWMKDLGK